jgi:hypothetical protein
LLLLLLLPLLLLPLLPLLLLLLLLLPLLLLLVKRLTSLNCTMCGCTKQQWLMISRSTYLVTCSHGARCETLSMCVHLCKCLPAVLLPPAGHAAATAARGSGGHPYHRAAAGAAAEPSGQASKHFPTVPSSPSRHAL